MLDPFIRLQYVTIKYHICFNFPGSVVLTLANLEGEESFDGSVLGQADEVVQERVCDDELILIKG